MIKLWQHLTSNVIAGLVSKKPGFERDRDSMTVADKKLPGQDSNLDKENQNLLCYRYTTG